MRIHSRLRPKKLEQKKNNPQQTIKNGMVVPFDCKIANTPGAFGPACFVRFDGKKLVKLKEIQFFALIFLC
jgi:hypothetical protein